MIFIWLASWPSPTTGIQLELTFTLTLIFTAINSIVYLFDFLNNWWEAFSTELPNPLLTVAFSLSLFVTVSSIPYANLTTQRVLMVAVSVFASSKWRFTFTFKSLAPKHSCFWMLWRSDLQRAALKFTTSSDKALLQQLLSDAELRDCSPDIQHNLLLDIALCQ